jgi:hypothetical protein
MHYIFLVLSFVLCIGIFQEGSKRAKDLMVQMEESQTTDRRR